MSVLVEFRISNVEPPTPEPSRTVYNDIFNMPDPVLLDLTVRIYNYDEVGLYMRVDGYDSAWAFSDNKLGLLGSASNMQRCLDQFGSRARPNAETSESVTVRLRAYTDSGYTNLKWTFERTVDIMFIKSNDGSWTQDFLNNFDDGTVQGWAHAIEEKCYQKSFGVVSDYVLSPPYSLCAHREGTGTGHNRSRFYKSFVTPNKNKVFTIIDARFDNDVFNTGGLRRNVYVEIQRDDTLILHLGIQYAEAPLSIQGFPNERWLRFIVPLPKNETIEVRLVYDCYDDGTAVWSKFWMDDFRIISKD